MNSSMPPEGEQNDGHVRVVGDRTVFVCDPTGPSVSSGQDAVDIIGQTWHSSADLVAIPVARLDDGFFVLSTGLAGEFIQKFANYQVSIAIIGDISAHLQTSSALRAFVHESNRGRQVWFLDDLDQLDARLTTVRRQARPMGSAWRPRKLGRWGSAWRPRKLGRLGSAGRMRFSLALASSAD